MELTLTIQAARPAAAIGNGRAAALVAPDGTIEWLAMPHSGGESIFNSAGKPPATFSLAPENGRLTSRGYIGETAVLETLWECPDGSRAQVVDFLPVRTIGDGTSPRWVHDRLVRIVEVLEGTMTFHYRLSPRPDGRAVNLVEDPNGLIFMGAGSALVLQTAGDVTLRRDGSIDGRVKLEKGQRHGCLLTWYGTPDPDVREATTTEPDWELDATYEYWLAFARACPFQGAQREHILRLLALLKAWLPQPGTEGLPPFFTGPFAPIAPLVLAAWGHEAELAPAAAAWPPAPIGAGWLLDALAAGNATGLLDPFAWLDAWPRLAAAADALAAVRAHPAPSRNPDAASPWPPAGAADVALDLAIVAGLRGAAALAEDLLQPGEVAGWRQAADAAANRLRMRPDLAPAGWEVALGLSADAGAGVDIAPADPTAAYWAIRRELSGGAYLQARRLLDGYMRDQLPARPGLAPDLGSLAGLLWLAALVYLQSPPTPVRVQLPGDLGD